MYSSKAKSASSPRPSAARASPSFLFACGSVGRRAIAFSKSGIASLNRDCKDKILRRAS